MRIAYITHYFPPAGFAASVNTYRIVEALAEKGHEVFVYCPQTFSKYTTAPSMGKKLNSSTFKVYASLPTPLSLSTTIPHVLNFLRALRNEYDLVITQFHLFHLAYFPGFLLKILRQKPWIIRVHDMIPDLSIPTPLLERLFIDSSFRVLTKGIGKKADKSLVLTEELRNLLIKYGHQPSKVAVVPNGVDTRIFHPTTSKSVSNPQKSILYVGSLMPEDGVDRLVQGFSILDNREDDLSLMIIGDGPERIRLLESVERSNLSKKVTFYRHVPHHLIPEFVRGAYVTVGPLRFSPINAYTIPTKILEYFACGKPVVSSAVSRDILRDESTGLVVQNATPEKIAEKLSILLEDEKLASKLGKNARLLVEQRFDWTKVIDSLEEEIEEVAAR